MTVLTYTVRAGDPARVARAVLGYQLRQSRFVGAVAVIVAVFAVIGAVGAGVTGAIVGVALALAIQLGVAVVLHARLRRVMRATIYRPGAQLQAEFDDVQFAVDTPAGSALHRYDSLLGVQRVGDVAVFRLGGGGVLALPAEVVPDERMAQLIRARP